MSKIVNLIDVLSVKVDAFSRQADLKCKSCGKNNHTEKQCFKLKTCFKCQKKGHISRFCRENTGSNTSAAIIPGVCNIEPAKRVLLKINIGGNDFTFLHDTGSQFSIITRKTYESIPVRPPLQKVDKNGIGIDGSNFKFDGIVYLNLALLKQDGSYYNLQYEPVLVSKNISANIYGMNTEERFKSCLRNKEDLTMTYVTKSDSEIIHVKCFKENIDATTAYIRIAKSTIIPNRTVKMVKGLVTNFKDVDSETPYLLESSLNREDVIVEPVKIDDLTRKIEIPIGNNSDESIRLKKGSIMANATKLDIIDMKSVACDSASVTEVSATEMFSDRSDLSGDEKGSLVDMISKYQMEINKCEDQPKVPYEHEINVIDDQPVSSPARRLAYSQREEIDNQIDTLLEKKYIVPSTSPYASPIVPVVKKDGSIRMCVDYRKLNKKTVPCNYPVARLEDLFEATSGCDTFSVIDLKQAYYHIPIKAVDRPKTAFVVSDRKFEWLRMPFGLHGASFSLAAAMVEVLSDCRNFAKAYYDDCIIFSKGRSAHLTHLEKLLEKFNLYGLHINLLKSQFMQSDVIFLGHILSGQGIFPEVGKVEEVVNFFTPTCASEVKSFLGMASFFRKFVPNFSLHAAPLFDLLKKDKEFVWSVVCQKSFDYVKAKLKAPELLVHPLFDRPFVIQCDASGSAVGFMLAQQHGDQLRPVMFGGRVLSDTERRYATIDKELLACYFAVKRSEIYLLGHDFIVYTDHKPLLSLSAFKDVLNKRFRWIQFLESVGTRLRYLPGKQNVVADFISRNSVQSDDKLDVLRLNALELSAVSYDQHELVAMQRNDAILEQVIEGLKTNSEIPKVYRMSKNKLFIENDLLMYNHHGYNLVVAPSEIRLEILDMCHSQWCSGHFGVFKTHKRVLKSFWWPCLYQEITQFISDCEICLSVKRLCRNPGRMGMRSFPTSPMELVSIDYLVELPVTRRGNRHILSINDHFSKFSQIYAVPDRTAITAAKCVFDFFLRFGIPLKLYSDRDPAFEANLFQSLMKMFGVKKLRTTGYNPRANGLTEKANEFIKNYLASYVNYSDQEWDLWCREAAYAYNSSVHSSTGFTPAKLMFGRDYRVPLDVLYNVRNDSHAFTTVSQYERTLQNLYEIARQNMEARQVAAATYYDKKVLDDELKVGESVFVFAPRNKSKKLALKWFGPHRVITCKHPAYEIRTGSETKWVTRDKLKRVSSRVKPNIIKEPEIVTPQVVNELEDESSDSDSDEDVDIGHRGRGRYGLRPNPGLVQRLHPTFSHSLFF